MDFLEGVLGRSCCGRVSKLSTGLGDIATLQAPHGTEALLAALRRARGVGRWRAADARTEALRGRGWREFIVRR